MTTRYPGGLINKSSANTSLSSASGMWSLPTATQKAKLDQWPVGGVSNPISYSLRLRSAASGYLTRTQTSTTSTTAWSYSAWVKRGSNLGSAGFLLGAGTVSSNDSGIYFETDNTLIVSKRSSFTIGTTQVFRDTSAWYHIVVAYDSTQATSSNRLKVYINGVQVTALNYSTYPTLNETCTLNSSGTTEYIGRRGDGYYFDGYMAEINFIDGQQLTPESFGKTNGTTGVWESIKYTGTYGTNGFYLPFNTPSNMGKDGSGNNNNWTLNGFNTSTANTTYDVVSDVPTQWTPRASTTDTGGVVRGNYNVFLMTDVAGVTSGNLQDAGLYTQTSGESYGAFGTNIGFSSGKWYFEYVPVQGNSDTGGKANYPCFVLTTTFAIADTGDSRLYNMNCGTFDGDGGTYMVAIDADNGYIYRGRNGAWSNNATATGISTGTGVGAVRTFTTGVQYRVGIIHRDGGPSFAGSSKAWTNFGQRPFTYTPPTGYKTLNTTNLPEPTIKQGNQYFDISLYTGNGTGQSITGVNFQPDFVWIKERSSTSSHALFDAIRGVNKVLATNTTDVEDTSNSQLLTSYNSDGFTVSGPDNQRTNENSVTYVGWQWNAGGSTVTNTSGTISSQVRANPTAGFSIVSYTGTDTTGSTVGHGLGVAPKMIIVKARNDTQNWTVYHTSWGNTGGGVLNLTNAFQNQSGWWSNTSPSSTVFTLGGSTGTDWYNTNKNGINYLAYCFTNVEGYSKFGSYTGNGSTDGPFVYCGFRPKWILVKSTGSGNDWQIYDAARDLYNPTKTNLLPMANNGDGSSTSIYDRFDFLSNGFKVRGENNAVNYSGGLMIYAAFAEHPFKNSLAR